VRKGNYAFVSDSFHVDLQLLFPSACWHRSRLAKYRACTRRLSIAEGGGGGKVRTLES